ncbi:cAMP-dependent protein kinase type 2 [Cladobotryum mycophilum]|uniref:cAMP-dependent protein kinase n=1 Tax=Cladobotryum mycophilum TaxID=491253 RepID=A0ABR0SE69_9HYPO
MPSLGGFLKKKRTREGNTDPSAANPTSPVAPTASKPFESSSSTSSHPPRQLPVQASSTASPGSISPSAPASVPESEKGTATENNQQQRLSQQQNTMNPVPSSYAAPASMAHDSQNLPSISNLINSPQNDGSPNSGSNNNNNNNYSSYQANPSNDPAGPMQQQQIQAQQMQQQQQQQQQQPHHHHQQQASVSEPRVTKGKYSLNDFEILRTLGTGSFGRVHLVQSKHNQRFYAVKVLKKAQVVKMKQVEHTNDERRMLSDVKHPFLITLWGTFQDWKNLYMVMDFVEGGELFSLLRKSGRFPNPVAKFYAAEATLALEYLHLKNIIYRDLKPENLLLDRHGHLKITDFGFAKRVPDKTWTLCGTPDYLAPEVVSNKGYNKSVDWWSLGILIYEMLCGYTPFWDSGSPMRIYENILKGKVKYPAYINPDAQNLLERLITADLTKRLGNLFGGSQDVKNHPWFAEVTWDRLARKDIDAPYTPPVKAGSGDASQFDRYPEDPEKYGGPDGSDEYGHLFTEF